jgi:predicted nucleic acid-binding protein
VVLDADVLIGALDGSDSHHASARALFAQWQQRDIVRLVSVVNLTEVLVAPAAETKRLRLARRAVAALGAAVHQPPEAVGVEAARLRAAHPISIPDAYCLATARLAGAPVASFDARVAAAAESEGIALAASPG